RRMLGRIYTRSIGDSQQGKINEEMVKKSIEQYQIITTKDPKDIESWLTLGRLFRVSQNSVEAEKAFKKALSASTEFCDTRNSLPSVSQLSISLGSFVVMIWYCSIDFLTISSLILPCCESPMERV